MFFVKMSYNRPKMLMKLIFLMFFLRYFINIRTRSICFSYTLSGYDILRLKRSSLNPKLTANKYM